MAVQYPLSADQIESHNAERLAALEDEYESLGRSLKRRGIDIDHIKAKVALFSVALPTWGSGVGGKKGPRLRRPRP